jgi:hypothetical protein
VIPQACHRKIDLPYVRITNEENPTRFVGRSDLVYFRDVAVAFPVRAVQPLFVVEDAVFAEVAGYGKGAPFSLFPLVLIITLSSLG